MNKVRCFFGLLLLLSVVSCSLFTSNDVKEPVARVNDHYLTEGDITEILQINVGADSSIFVQNYINKWATEQLLLDGAKRNIPESVQGDFDKLVLNYKRDLYTKYYEDMLLNRELDSIVHIDEAKRFYEENKNNFLLNESLVQFKFIAFEDEESVDDDLKKIFKNGSKNDLKKLDSLKFTFKNHFLNDSSWVKTSRVVEQVNVITNENKNRLLKKTNFIQLRDSLGLYLIAVKNRLDRNDIAPLEYVRPTINQIIINKRKLELIKKLEKEIKDDAIKNKQFEIYN